ncbi:MAG: hypothetical protein K2X11_03225 [Acetobacteraceae bacterium]|nr:hypothetical protein [Acetobacteraceae bacterium]
MPQPTPVVAQQAAPAPAVPPQLRQPELPTGGPGWGGLFRKATGLMRRPGMEEPAPAAPPVRAEPAAPKPAKSEATDFDIPAFLRRQGN